MTHWMTWIARAIVFVTLFLPEETSVNASTCALDEKPSSVAEAYASSTSVFKGRVVEINGEYDAENDDDIIVKFKVLKNWKGADSRHVTITTIYPDYGGVYFQKRKNYIVYTEGEDFVSMCGYTKKVSKDKRRKSKEEKKLDRLSRSRNLLVSSSLGIGDGAGISDTNADNANASI